MLLHRKIRSIGFFRTLGTVLEDQVQFVADEQGVKPPVVHEQILAEAAKNHAEWFSDRVPNLNYAAPACRLAYLYIVAAANAGSFMHILTEDDGNAKGDAITSPNGSRPPSSPPGVKLRAKDELWKKLGY